MKKLITLLVMSLMFLGCEESSGPSAKTTAATPEAIVDQPAEPVVINPKTLYFEFVTSEPTSYEIRLFKWIGDAYEAQPSVRIQKVTSQEKTYESVDVDCVCVVSVFKYESTKDSVLTINKGDAPISYITYTNETKNNILYFY